MLERIICPSCGASLKFEGEENSLKCAYCGSTVIYTEAEKATDETRVNASELDALGFLNSLEIEVNGERYPLTDIWDSYITNRMGVDKMIMFYKNFRDRIINAIKLYENLPDNVKAELGDFVCKQMVSIINFRIEHGLKYIDELEYLNSYYNKIQYESGAVGIFNLKKKIFYFKKMLRIKARKALLIYDAAVYSVEQIKSKFDSKVQPLKEELNATAKTAFSRRKEIKYQIENLEMEKENAIAKLGLKEKTKSYKLYKMLFKINHVDLLKENEGEKKAPTFVGGVTAKPVVKEPEVNYSEMPINDLLNALEASLDVLCKGIVQGELNKCKKIVEALDANTSISEDARIYANAVTLSLKMAIQNDNPTIVKSILNSTIVNTKQQINTLRTKI